MLSMKNVKALAEDIVFDFIGCMLYTVGIYVFAMKAQFTTGGVSGLALAINHLSGLPMGAITLLLNIPIIFISYKVLGKIFLLKSLKTMVILSFCIDYIGPMLPQYSGNKIIAAIFMGICIGTGLVLVYMRGSSTGGADFITLSIRKKRPHLSVGNIAAATDVIVLIIGGLAFKSVDASLYGAISVFICSTVMDRIMYGAGSGKLLFIVTDKGQEVATAIWKASERGCTIADVRGSYQGEKRQLVISAMSKSQLFASRKAAHQVDDGCFMMVTATDEVFGEGFADPRAD